MAIRTVTRAGVGLVVGIIILGLLVLGGLWLVRERGDQARRDEAITIADQRLKAESRQDAAQNSDNTNSDNNEEESNPKPSEVASEPQNTPTIPQGGTSTTNPESADELPQTGPEATSIAALGILSFAVLSFVHSRKLLSNQ